MKKFKVLKTLFLYFTLATTGVLFASGSLWAQGGGGPIPPAALPLSGIGALLAVGISAGIFFYKKKKKDEK